MLLVIGWIFLLVIVFGLIASRGDKLALLNFVILQWIFFRYVRVEDGETGRFMRMGWQGPIVPLTGWWTDTVPRNAPILRTKEEREADEKEGPLVKRKRKHNVKGFGG
jgi:hypothetical protein